MRGVTPSGAVWGVSGCGSGAGVAAATRINCPSTAAELANLDRPVTTSGKDGWLNNTLQLPDF